MRSLGRHQLEGNQMSDKTYSESDQRKDILELHSMGYAQELERRMNRFSNFAISFSIICILSGGINSLAQAISGAGGAAIGIGWPVGCAISGVFAIAMAQIASAYPTAGGLYHWGSILGNRFWGWLTAWLNLIGLVTVLAAINVGTWTFFAGAFGDKLGLVSDTSTSAGYWQQLIFVALITALQALINHRGIGLTAKLTDFSGYLIFATAVALTLACLVWAKSWDISRLWNFHNYSGLPEGDSSVWPKSDSIFFIFLLGLLLPIYTITGYDASAHTSEETQKAALWAPRGMISSVWWSALFGWLLLCSFVLIIPDMDEAAKQGFNVFFWAVNGAMPAAVAFILYVAIFLSQLLCGLATVTSASRMIFAFSRDGGLPGSGALRAVSPKFRTPVNAIWTAAVLSVLFTVPTSVYTTVVSVTVIFLFISFAVPIALGFFAFGRTWTKMGPWNIGGLYRFVAILSILSAILIFYIGVQPPNDKALGITIGFVIVTAIVWVAFENKRFQGPPIGDIIAKRQEEIAKAEALVGQT
jgi:amino acid transporter